MKDIFLIEDHHQALDIWRRLRIKDFPLVHLDSHIDFGFYQAKPILQILEEAKTLKDLKEQLEKTLLYQRYKDDLETQLNIGNYIYPAMRDRIVNKFFWLCLVIEKYSSPALPILKNLLKELNPIILIEIKI